VDYSARKDDVWDGLSVRMRLLVSTLAIVERLMFAWLAQYKLVGSVCCRIWIMSLSHFTILRTILSVSLLLFPSMRHSYKDTHRHTQTKTENKHVRREEPDEEPSHVPDISLDARVEKLYVMVFGNECRLSDFISLIFLHEIKLQV